MRETTTCDSERSAAQKSSWELEGKLLGELSDGPSTQINVQVLAPVILEALTPFPEARQAVAARLRELETPTSG